MRTQITYEWACETLEDGEITDINHTDYPVKIIEGERLALVRNEGNERDGITDRVWAYVVNGLLPEFFENAMGEATQIKVPIKYNNQLKKI